ncbi:MAG: translation elongation factor Ts [Candidatus Falkowbacteria bacterium]
METIKKLREMTGAGMVDCKKALDEAAGDLNKAVEILRKKGIAKAAKRTDRETNEGVVMVSVNENATEAYMVEVNSETDFVSRNDKFQDFTKQVLELVKTLKPGSLEELLAAPFSGVTLKESLETLSGVIGEKLDIKRLAIVSGEKVAAYSHLGGRIGVLVAFNQVVDPEIASDVAMQVAAANPKYLIASEVPTEEMDKEKEIYRTLLLKEGKPAEMVDKIVEGKMSKYYSEVCLTEQEYIKDDKKKVKDILGGASITQFVRFSL